MFAVDFSKSPAKVRSFFKTTKLLHHFFIFSGKNTCFHPFYNLIVP